MLTNLEKLNFLDAIKQGFWDEEFALDYVGELSMPSQVSYSREAKENNTDTEEKAMWRESKIRVMWPWGQECQDSH